MIINVDAARLESEVFPVAKIHTFGTIVNGGTPTSTDDNWNGDIPFITPPDLNELEGKEVTSVSRSITNLGLQSGSSSVEKGVIISCRAPVGYVGRVTAPSAFNQGCKVILTGQEHRYVAYVLAASQGNLQILANGTTFPEISSTSLANYAVPLPPFETQQRIADYLDRETAEIDAAVADLDKYVELLEKRRQVLVSEAVDSLSSASLIKTVRNLETLGWLELGRGKVISKEDMENSPGDYPVYSSAFTDNGFFGKYGEYLFEDERISWSIDGGGMPFYRHKHRYSLTNVSGWMRVADNSVLDVKYLYYAVLNEWYRNSFDYALKAHPSVIRDLYSISIPALSSQQQMADYLDRETVEIGNLIAESKKLRDLLLKRRSVLITEVVTGRKQV